MAKRKTETEAEYRERERKRNRERKAAPEFREWRRKRYRVYRADPEYCERERERNRERYAFNSEYRERERKRERAYRIDPTIRARALVRGACHRAKKTDVPFNLTESLPDIEWVVDVGRCEMTGVRLDFTSVRRTWRSPSLDRIVPELGYVTGNVRVVCWGMNAALGTWGADVLLQMVCSWARFDPDVGAVLRAVLDGSSTTTNEGEEDDGDEEEPQGRVQAVPVLRRGEEVGAEAEG